MPLTAYIVSKVHIKVVLFMSCAAILSASITFIYSKEFWIFIAFQCIFATFASTVFLLASYMLAWEWYSPKCRGLMTGVVQSLESLTTAFVVLL